MLVERVVRCVGLPEFVCGLTLWRPDTWSELRRERGVSPAVSEVSGARAAPKYGAARGTGATSLTRATSPRRPLP
eukprot:6055275-Prymnesium_polylepis.1